MNLQSFLAKNLDHHKSKGFQRALSILWNTINAYDDASRYLQASNLLLRAIGGARRVCNRHFKCCTIYTAIEVAKELGSGKKVLALADNGERYPSTTLYEFE